MSADPSELDPARHSANNSILPLVHNQLAKDKPVAGVLCQYDEPVNFPWRKFLPAGASLADDFGEPVYDRHIGAHEPHGQFGRTALRPAAELWSCKQVR